jgi:lipid II:glycine glycyltransferase (peptidoglycan interpeptide bridge formation enzyme)
MENAANVEVREDVRQSAEYACYMKAIGWKVVQLKNIRMFIRKLGPVAITKIQRVKLPIEWKEVREILNKERVFMCKIEPLVSGELPPGFKRDGWPLLETKTLRIDLRIDAGGLMAGFKKDARYELRRFLLRNTNVEINQFERFYSIWKQSTKRKNLWMPRFKDFMALVEAFGNKCFCITVKDMGGAMVLTHKGTAYYHYAGATKEGNLQNVPYWVVWQAMLEAKKRGCKVWDFGGIADARWPNKGWRGFSHFKKSFGGVEVEYPGCFTVWRLPW